MNKKYKSALVVGNGPSRKGVDLSLFVKKIRPKDLYDTAVFGCNAFYRDYAPDYTLPDYLVAIDNKIIKEIENSDFPKDKFIVPPVHERYEPQELWPSMHSTPRSNAGMNAILEAIKRGFNVIDLVGFDFLCLDEQKVDGNVYEDTPCYEQDTKCSVQDARRRLYYFTYVIQKHPKVDFFVWFKKGETIYMPDIVNIQKRAYANIYIP